MQLAQEALGPTLRNGQPAITLDKITALICSQYQVKVSDLRSKRRSRSISLPRKLSFAILAPVYRKKFAATFLIPSLAVVKPVVDSDSDCQKLGGSSKTTVVRLWWRASLAEERHLQLHFLCSRARLCL